jgi:hypothetical protein
MCSFKIKSCILCIDVCNSNHACNLYMTRCVCQLQSIHLHRLGQHNYFSNPFNLPYLSMNSKHVLHTKDLIILESCVLVRSGVIYYLQEVGTPKRACDFALLQHNLATNTKPSQGAKTSGTSKMLPLSPRQQIPSF